MKKVGQVLHIAPSKKAVVKAERTPKVGEAVFDVERRRIGTVFDVFGPTSSPYVEVEIKVKDSQSIVSKDVYVSSASKYQQRSRVE